MMKLNKIYNMDCMDGLAELDNNIIDLIVTDPPYEVDYDKKSIALHKIDNARTKQIERDKHFQTFTKFSYLKFASELNRVLRKPSHIYVWCGTQQLFKWYKILDSVGFKFMDLLFWIKDRQTFDLSCGYHYNYRIEQCMFWSYGSKKLSKLGLSNVIEHNIKQVLLHPTEKPLKIMEYLITASSKEGDLVFDPFMGSGTTAIACKNLNRQFIGFEISKKYYDDANKRLKEHETYDLLSY